MDTLYCNNIRLKTTQNNTGDGNNNMKERNNKKVVLKIG
jgi:hypothetical protein